MAITIEQYGEFIRINETRVRIRDIVTYNGISNEGYGGKGRYILKVIYKTSGADQFQLKATGNSKEELDTALSALDTIMHQVAQPNPQI